MQIYFYLGYAIFDKNCLHVNCLQDGFVMYNDKVLIIKQWVILPISDAMIPVGFCLKTIVNIFTTGDMTPKSE